MKTEGPRLNPLLVRSLLDDHGIDTGQPQLGAEHQPGRAAARNNHSIVSQNIRVSRGALYGMVRGLKQDPCALHPKVGERDFSCHRPLQRSVCLEQSTMRPFPKSSHGCAVRPNCGSRRTSEHVSPVKYPAEFASGGKPAVARIGERRLTRKLAQGPQHPRKITHNIVSRSAERASSLRYTSSAYASGEATMNVRTAVLVAASLTLLTAWGEPQETSYEECMLNKMQGQHAQMQPIVDKLCSKKYQREALFYDYDMLKWTIGPRKPGTPFIVMITYKGNEHTITGGVFKFGASCNEPMNQYKEYDVFPVQDADDKLMVVISAEEPSPNCMITEKLFGKYR